MKSLVVFVLPSMRISGGVAETIRLATQLRALGSETRILSLWKHPTSVDLVNVQDYSNVPVTYLSDFTPRKHRAWIDLMLLLVRFRPYLRALEGATGSTAKVVTTHYSTLPFGWFTSRELRYCFLQDEEWLFVSNSIFRAALRQFILFSCRRCHVITSNAYISERFRQEGITPVAEARIWAAPEFQSDPKHTERTIQLVMLLRHGAIKRLDLYLALLAKAKQEGIVCAAITCEDDIAIQVSHLTDICTLRPSNREMMSIYQQSKIFVLLSEREGFGLPPLEAMGSGCIPVCRDSGGVRSYMTGLLADNLIPLDAPLDSILDRLRALLSTNERLQMLSTESQNIFSRGAAQCQYERERALNLLAKGHPAREVHS